MIEISFGKLLLLALIALVVLGPEKLPGAARTAGALLRRLRSGWDSVRTEVERELELEEIRRHAREAARRAEAAQAGANAAVREAREGVAAVVTAVRQVPVDAGAGAATARAPDAAPTGDLFGPAPAASGEAPHGDA